LDGEDASFESAITEVTSIDLGSEVVEETLLNGECPPEKKCMLFTLIYEFY
jgi:hypothetical protein